MVDTLALSGALHMLLVITLTLSGVSISLITRSRAGLVLTLAVGAALAF